MASEATCGESCSEEVARLSLELTTLLNRCYRFKGFVYGKVQWAKASPNTIEIEVIPRRGGAIDAAFLPSGHRAWRRPEQVVAPRSEKARPGRPALTTDSAGDFIMAWRQFIGGQTRIDASVRQTTTKRWTPPIMVNDPSIGENTALRDIPSLLKKRLIALYGAPAGPRVSNPVLSGGTRGPVIAVWSQGNSQYTAIYASRYR